jgi:transposase-like protein
MNEEQVCAVRRRRSRQEVEQVVAEYESSGLSRIEFCRERGLALSTLGRYRRRRERQAPTGSNALLAVEVSGGAPAPVAAMGSALAVVLRGGRRIEVGRGFDTGALEQLVRVLEGV